MINYEKKDISYYGLPRLELLKLVPDIQGRVLDIGCGDGATLQYLASKGVKNVVGIELFDEARKKAIERGLNVFKVDVEKEELPFKEKEFDYIILADILEHLYDPWKVLKKIVKYLKDDGTILISMPNMKFYGVLLNLIFRDRWEYTENGILDATHIRFFTLKELKKLIKASDLKISKLVFFYYNCPAILRAMNFMLAGKLKTLCTYQFLVAASKS